MNDSMPQMWRAVTRREVEFRWLLFTGAPIREAALRAFGSEPYSKVWNGDSKVSECYSESPVKMAEWTGLEPATPGVTGRGMK